MIKPEAERIQEKISSSMNELDKHKPQIFHFCLFLPSDMHFLCCTVYGLCLTLWFSSKEQEES
jgi:hypothetical protein